jgi:hypothetical protein
MTAREYLTPDEIEIERQTMLLEQQDRWWATSPKNAVEYLEYQIFRRDLQAHKYQHYNGRPSDQIDDTVTLPLDAARLLLDCARKGMRKGRGKGNQPLSREDRRIRGLIFDFGRRRKAELIAARHPSILVGPDDNPRPSAAEAEAKAAEDARKHGFDHYGVALAKSTIIRGMRSRL